MAGFTVNQGAIRVAIQSPRHRAHRDLLRRADRVVAQAKINVPVKSGNLRSTIGRSDARPSPSGLTVTIYAGARYAAAIHEGRGSRYAPRSWRRRGPGPRRFLANALSAAGGRRGR